MSLNETPLGVWCFRTVPVCQRWRHKQQGIWNSCSLRCRCHAGKPCFLKKQVKVEENMEKREMPWDACALARLKYLSTSLEDISLTELKIHEWFLELELIGSQKPISSNVYLKSKRVVFFGGAPQLTSGCKLRLLIRASWNRLMPPDVILLITTGNPKP